MASLIFQRMDKFGLILASQINPIRNGVDGSPMDSAATAT